RISHAQPRSRSLGIAVVSAGRRKQNGGLLHRGKEPGEIWKCPRQYLLLPPLPECHEQRRLSSPPQAKFGRGPPHQKILIVVQAQRHRTSQIRSVSFSNRDSSAGLRPGTQRRSAIRRSWPFNLEPCGRISAGHCLLSSERPQTSVVSTAMFPFSCPPRHFDWSGSPARQFVRLSA